MNEDKSIEITDSIYFIGAFDPDIRTFDIIMKTKNGTSYNAYLIKTSDGVIIVDGVKEEFGEDYFHKIEQLCSYDEIKYIISHHLEPDHVGTIPKLIKKAPNAKVLISPKAEPMLKAIVNSQDINFEKVWTNKSIALGEKTITFLTTPYLHWPETMSSYVIEDKLLFSGDAFGSHFCDKRLYDDLVDDFMSSFKYYYDSLMRPFKTHVLNALKLYEKFEIDTIATLHGPILRTNPKKYIDLYRDFSSDNEIQDNKKIISILYLTSYKNTKTMAHHICKGCESDNTFADMYDLVELNRDEVIDILEKSDGVLIGTPTINADAPKPVWDILSYMSFLEKRGKVASSFGSYGWSGEAVDMVYERLKSLNFRVMLEEPLKIKLIPNEDELKQCFDFGVEFMQIVNGKMVEIDMN